jgi:predicted Zn-dependent protease
VNTDPQPVVKLRITARGQAALVALVTIVLVIVVSFFTFGATGANASLESAPNDFTYVSVQSGQTLWQLATELDPESDPRDVIAEIVLLNALPSSDVEAGQRIAIPKRLS